MLSTDLKTQLAALEMSIDRRNFTHQPYVRRIEKPWGYELHFTPDSLPYMGKILHINGGKRLSLQLHDQKMESWFLLHGNVTMVMENSEGDLLEVKMEPGFGFTTHVGQRHRLLAEEDSDVIEVSMPEVGNTYRLEDDYIRPTETEEMRQQPNRGWA